MPADGQSAFRLVSNAPREVSGAMARADSHSRNSYDFIRFCAALAVLFSHHFAISGRPEPLVAGYGENFGELGVEIFFCLSGFLICQSLQKSNDWSRFFAARALRIFPNLAIALLATSVVTLVWLQNYSHLSAHAAFVGDNLLMFVTGFTHTIPGVFANFAEPGVNEPLWTLPYELWLYLILFLIFLMGARRNGTWIVLGMALLALAWTAAPVIGEFNVGPLENSELFRLGSYFLSGAVLAVFWHRLARHALAIGAAGLVSVFAVHNLLPVDTAFHSLALATCVVGLGSTRLMAWFGKGGDASYGMYVFAWPVQQFSVLLIGAFWPSMAISAVVATALGYASWHAYEKRALSQRDRLAVALRSSAALLWLQVRRIAAAAGKGQGAAAPLLVRREAYPPAARERVER